MIKTKDIKNFKHISDPTEEKLNNLKLVSQDTNKDIVSIQGELTKDILKARSLERLDAIETDSSDLNDKIGEIETSVAEELTEITGRTETVISNSKKYKQDIEAFLSVAKGDDFLFFLDDCTRAVGRLDKLTNGSNLCRSKKITSWDIPLPSLTNGINMFRSCKLTSWNISLSELTIGGGVNLGMFTGCKSLTSWNIPLPSLTNGEEMFFYCDALKSFSGDLSNLTRGVSMFHYTALTSWNIPLPKLTIGGSMFWGTNIANWDISLPALTNGGYMFYECALLTNFSTDLPALTSGGSMFFKCTSLTSWNIPLPALTNSGGMFERCTSLTSFSSNMSKLTSAFGGAHGTGMFKGCTALTNFSADLPALTNGRGMFEGCKLNLASIQNIADTINNLAIQNKTGSITIGIDASIRYNDNLTEEEQSDATAAKNAIATIVAKGWVVTEQYN